MRIVYKAELETIVDSSNVDQYILQVTDRYSIFNVGDLFLLVENIYLDPPCYHLVENFKSLQSAVNEAAMGLIRRLN